MWKVVFATVVEVENGAKVVCAAMLERLWTGLSGGAKVASQSVSLYPSFRIEGCRQTASGGRLGGLFLNLC